MAFCLDVYSYIFFLVWQQFAATSILPLFQHRRTHSVRSIICAFVSWFVCLLSQVLFIICRCCRIASFAIRRRRHRRRRRRMSSPFISAGDGSAIVWKYDRHLRRHEPKMATIGKRQRASHKNERWEEVKEKCSSREAFLSFSFVHYPDRRRRGPETERKIRTVNF